VPSLFLNAHIASFAIEVGDSLAASSASSPLHSGRLSQSHSDGETPGRLPSAASLEPVPEECRSSKATAHQSDKAYTEADTDHERGKEKGSPGKEAQTGTIHVAMPVLSDLITAACGTSTLAKGGPAEEPACSGTETGEREESTDEGPSLQSASCPPASVPVSNLDASSDTGGGLDVRISGTAQRGQSSDMDSESVASLGSYLTGDRSPTSQSPWLHSGLHSKSKSHLESAAQPDGHGRHFTFPRSRELEGAHTFAFASVVHAMQRDRSTLIIGLTRMTCLQNALLVLLYVCAACRACMSRKDVIRLQFQEH
jgi:hypothetical protein